MQVTWSDRGALSFPTSAHQRHTLSSKLLWEGIGQRGCLLLRSETLCKIKSRSNLQLYVEA